MSDDRRIELVLPPAPPPSEELGAAVAHARPVRLWRPAREQAAAVLFCAAWALLVVGVIGPRADLPALPALRLYAGGLAWVLVVVAAVAVVTWPAGRQVLPHPGLVRLATIVLPILAAAAALLLLADAPGRTLEADPADAPLRIAHCLGSGLGIALLPLGVILVRARNRLIARPRWTGALVGVAAGSLSALVLHFACAYGGARHLLAGHGGALLVGALLGALVAPLVARLR